MIPGCPYKGLYPSLSCVCLSPCVCLLHSPQGHFLFFVGLGNLFPSGPSPLWKNSGMVFSCSFSDMASLPSQNKNLILVLFCSLSQTGTFLYPKPFRDGLPCPATSLLRQFAISRLEDGGFFRLKHLSPAGATVYRRESYGATYLLGVLSVRLPMAYAVVSKNPVAGAIHFSKCCSKLAHNGCVDFFSQCLEVHLLMPNRQKSPLG